MNPVTIVFLIVTALHSGREAGQITLPSMESCEALKAALPAETSGECRVRPTYPQSSPAFPVPADNFVSPY